MNVAGSPVVENHVRAYCRQQFERIASIGATYQWAFRRNSEEHRVGWSGGFDYDEMTQPSSICLTANDA